MKHQMNKLGVFSRWFTEADVKYFKSGALRTVTNKARSMPAMVNQKKKNPWQVYFKDFVHRYRIFS